MVEHRREAMCAKRQLALRSVEDVLVGRRQTWMKLAANVLWLS
jgi:hypothetical protein